MQVNVVCVKLINKIVHFAKVIEENIKIVKLSQFAHVVIKNLMMDFKNFVKVVNFYSFPNRLFIFLLKLYKFKRKLRTIIYKINSWQSIYIHKNLKKKTMLYIQLNELIFKTSIKRTANTAKTHHINLNVKK